MKCKKCGRDFDKSVMVHARNKDGVTPKSSKTYYCIKCEEQEYQRNVLVDYMHRLFLWHGYYTESKTESNRMEYQRIMKMVNSQFANLVKEGYTYQQIRVIIDYMIRYEKIEFSESITGLVPYYYLRVKRHYGELERISSNKTYGYIPPTKERVERRCVCKPNKDALNITKMELL